VVSVQRIYEYYKHFDYKTEVMGASFRKQRRDHRAGRLRYCSPSRPSSSASWPAARRRSSASSIRARQAVAVERIPMDRAIFDRMHAEDQMANDKLDEGIAGFSKSLVQLEDLLEKRLEALAAAGKLESVPVSSSA
jgi:transaldolase